MECQQIGAYDAKTHFSYVLENVERGKDYIVTKRGKPVAFITQIDSVKKMTYQEAVEALIGMQKFYRGKPGDFNIREAIEDGRKY